MAFSFLAATLIPVSSEAALAAAIALDQDTLLVLLFATIGNCAGVTVNFWIGAKGEEKFLRKHLQKKSMLRAYELTRRYGKWSLLLSWLPIIGDPLTLLAGVLRINFSLFLVLVFPLRLLRYVLIAGLID